jgi:hypothetical protein
MDPTIAQWLSDAYRAVFGTMDPRDATMISFGVIALVVGVGSVVWTARRVRAAQAWPTTSGRIIESRCDLVRQTSDGTPDVGHYRTLIRYEYRVGDSTLVGTRIRVGGDVHTSIKSRAEGIVGRYAVGDLVDVRFNPRRPLDACLELDGDAGMIGLACAALGLIIAVVGLARTIA